MVAMIVSGFFGQNCIPAPGSWRCNVIFHPPISHPSRSDPRTSMQVSNWNLVESKTRYQLFDQKGPLPVLQNALFFPLIYQRSTPDILSPVTAFVIFPDIVPDVQSSSSSLTVSRLIVSPSVSSSSVKG